MLTPLLKLLPVFVIEFLSRWCETVTIGGQEYRTVFKNVLILERKGE